MACFFVFPSKFPTKKRNFAKYVHVTKIFFMNKLFYFLMLGIALHFFSCSNPEQMQAHISKESTVVASVDSKRFATKILMDKFGNLSLSDLFSGGSDDDEQQAEKDSLAEALKPQDLGIDFLTDIYASAQLEENTKLYAVVYVKLSDSKKLEDAIKNKLPFAYRPKIQEKAGFQYGIISKKQSLIAWNESFCFIIISLNPESFVGLETYFDKIANLPKDQQILKDDNFLKIQEQTADVKVWAKMSSLYQKTGNLFGSLEGLDYLHSLIDFEKGQLSIKSKIFTDPAKNANFAKMYAKSNKFSVVNAIAEDQIIGVSSMRYDPSFIKVFLEKNAGSMVQFLPYLAFTGLGIQEIPNLFKGDFFQVQMKSVEVTQEVISYEFDDNFNKVEKKTLTKEFAQQSIFGASCDQTMNKLFDNLAKGGLLSKKETYYTFGSGANSGYFGINDNFLLVSSNLQLLNAKPTTSNYFGKMMAENPIFVHVDVQKLMKDEFVTSQKNEKAQKAISLVERLEKATLIGSEMKENIANIDFTLDLMNKNENALFEILAIIKAASETVKEEQKPQL